MVLPQNFTYPMDSTSNKREGSPENESKTEFASMYRKKTAGICWTRNPQRKNREPCTKWNLVQIALIALNFRENVQGGHNDIYLQKTLTKFSNTVLNDGKLHKTEFYGNPS